MDHPRNPEGSSYAITKTTNELFLELSGLDYVTFRLANVVGPRNVAGPLPIFSASKIINNVSLPKIEDICLCHGSPKMRYQSYSFKRCMALITFLLAKDVAILELYDEVVKSMRLNEYPQPEIKDCLVKMMSNLSYLLQKGL